MQFCSKKLARVWILLHIGCCMCPVKKLKISWKPIKIYASN
jgi:hypothetical protein